MDAQERLVRLCMHTKTYLTGVEDEQHKDVLERVLEVTTHPSGPSTLGNYPPQRP